MRGPQHPLMASHSSELTRRQALAGLGGTAFLALTGCATNARFAGLADAGPLDADTLLEQVAYNLLEHEPERATGLGVDSGAHAYLGHGPHILRGVEVYKNRPIFYSLGDFIIQNDSVERQPAEFFDIYGLDASHTPSDGFDARSANGTKGLAANQKVFESVMVSFEVEAGEIDSVNIMPITLGFEKNRSRKGRPELATIEDGNRILADLARLSAEYETTIEINDGHGRIRLAR